VLSDSETRTSILAHLLRKDFDHLKAIGSGGVVPRAKNKRARSL
jgi:hypothetical protein